MQIGVWGLALFALFASSPAHSQNIDGANSISLDRGLLETISSESVTRIRSSCAFGDISATYERNRRAGFEPVEPVTACLTVLTRLGREGRLNYVRDRRSDQRTPALAFDQGFVAGYKAREPMAPNAPSWAALRPLIIQCLDQVQSNTDLCYAAGQIAATRIVHRAGVTIAAP